MKRLPTGSLYHVNLQKPNGASLTKLDGLPGHDIDLPAALNRGVACDGLH